MRCIVVVLILVGATFFFCCAAMPVEAQQTTREVVSIKTYEGDFPLDEVAIIESGAIVVAVDGDKERCLPALQEALESKAKSTVFMVYFLPGDHTMDFVISDKTYRAKFSAKAGHKYNPTIKKETLFEGLRKISEDMVIGIEDLSTEEFYPALEVGQ